MSQYLSLSRAARLAGVSRGDLQERVRRMALPTFEGSIAVADLLQAYPRLDLEQDPVLERVEAIKAKAKPKRHYTDHWLPEPEVLLARVQDFQQVLMRTKGALNNNEQLLREVALQLEEAAQLDGDALRLAVIRLTNRLRQSQEWADRHPDPEAKLFAKDAWLRVLAASVRMQPSGHEFFVEGGETLLDAALKSGLHLAYGCASGNCGACKVRIANGQTRQVRDHDHVLSTQERNAGFVLACCHTAVSDLVVDALEARGAADLPFQQIRCRVRALEPLGDQYLRARIQTPRTQTLRFLAGQRVELTTEDGSRGQVPLASCPCDARNLEVLLRRQAQPGLAAGLLAGGAGATVLVEGPQGGFLLDEAATDPLLFLAVEQGLGPVKSLIEQAIAIDNVPRVELYRIDSLPSGSPYDNQCRAWDDALDQFGCRRLAATTSPAELAAAVSRDVPRWTDYRIYAAGPGAWMDQLQAALIAAGADPARLVRDGID